MRYFLLTVLFSAMFLFSACSEFSSKDSVDRKLQQSIENTMKARQIVAEVTVERLKKVNKSDFYFFRVTVNATELKISQEQYLFFDGSYIVNDLINVDTGSGIADTFLIDYIDTSKLSLLQGNRDAKNVIIKITDFECPFCREAYTYLENKLRDRSDVAVYVAHLPLQIHPTAEMCARIFEAGLIMGKNFGHELFTNDSILDMSEDQLIKHFAELSGNAETFVPLLSSEGVTAKVAEGMKDAELLKVRSTPIMYFNGTKVSGFNQAEIDKAISAFK